MEESHRSPKDGSQLCKELPRAFLEEKFHLATVLHWPRAWRKAAAGLPTAGPSVQYITPVLLTRVEKQDCE